MWLVHGNELQTDKMLESLLQCVYAEKINQFYIVQPIAKATTYSEIAHAKPRPS